MGNYGVQETNPITKGFHNEKPEGSVCWTDPRLESIERLRLLSDPGFPMWDVSYCTGRLKDGTKVDVELPFDQLRKRRKINAQIVAYAKKDGVYAKRLGIFSAISTLN
jgi:hypothetical protein